MSLIKTLRQDPKPLTGFDYQVSQLRLNEFMALKGTEYQFWLCAVYLHTHATTALLGELFGCGQANASRRLKKGLPIIKTVLGEGISIPLEKCKSLDELKKRIAEIEFSLNQQGENSAA